MNIAIISDIHGNLVALEAVLAHIVAIGADQVLCLGDVAATGPQPHECIDRLRILNCPVVMGNTDAWLLEPAISARPDDTWRMFQEIDLWCSAQLTSADADLLRTFQPTLVVTLDEETSLLCCHGSPRSYDEIILASTPDDEIAQMLSDVHVSLLAGGHTHQPMLRRYKDTLLINPGSVGLPYEISRTTGVVRNPAWAEYGWIRLYHKQPTVEFCRVPIDVAAVKQAALQSGMPHANQWAAGWG